jgi:hypothetical protein
MHCDKLVTTAAREISITDVQAGSPADGIFLVGDTLLGVGGRPFSFDPRTEFGRAITEAESEAGGGKLIVSPKRDDHTQDVVVPLPVLGSYSDAAPFGCLKSKRLLEQGCKALAVRIAVPAYRQDSGLDAIPRALNTLALLASGNSDYLALVKQEAQWAADYSADSFRTWHYGGVIMLPSEYVMATGDPLVMPGLRRLAMEAATGQSESARGATASRFLTDASAVTG